MKFNLSQIESYSRKSIIQNGILGVTLKYKVWISVSITIDNIQCWAFSPYLWILNILSFKHVIEFTGQ